MRQPAFSAFVFMLLALACALVVALGLRGFVLYCLESPDRSSASFDSQVWKANSGRSPSNPRWNMCAEAERRLTPGLTKEAVLDLLGPPDSVQANQLLYCLGFWSGFRIDPDYLHIWLDGDGRIMFTGVLQH